MDDTQLTVTEKHQKPWGLQVQGKETKFSPTSGRSEQSKTLGFNTIHEVPAVLHEDNHNQRLPSSASLKEQWSLLFLMQHGPLSFPIRRPKNYMHRCIMFSFVKYHIFSIQPNRPTQCSSSQENLVSKFRLKPCSQEPNILAKLVGSWIPYVICTVFQTKRMK